jgi:hypothetical protein
MAPPLGMVLRLRLVAFGFEKEIRLLGDLLGRPSFSNHALLTVRLR